MSSLIDLTGTDEDFKIVNFPAVIHTDNQVVLLKQPVYAASVVIGIIEGESIVTAVIGTDYEINSGNFDPDALSEAKLLDADFNYQLIKSVTMKRSVSENGEYRIVISAQAFKHPDRYTYDTDVEGPTPTPALMADILEQLNLLMHITNPMSDLTATTLDGIKILEIDLSGTATENLIENEIRNFDATQGRHLIRPNAGSFYRTGLEVRKNGVLLVENTDYELEGFDLDRTKSSTSTSAVYNRILMLSGSGDVTLKYQAFGGEITIDDVEALKTSMISIVRFLQDKKFLTEDTFGYSILFGQVVARIAKLEEFVRHARIGGTDGLSSLFRLQRLDDSVHYFTVATLYRDRADAITEQDRAKFRITTLQSTLQVDVALNLDLRETNPITLTTINGMAQDYVSDYTKLDTRFPLAFRVVWVDATPHPGCVLQLAARLPEGLAEEQVLIEDLSRSGSSWQLQASTGIASTGEDDLIILPDESTVWNNADASAKSSVVPITPIDGVILWAGRQPLVEKLSLPITLKMIPEDTEWSVAQLQRMEYRVYDRVYNTVVTASIDCRKGDNLVSGFARNMQEFDRLDFCAIGHEITQQLDHSIQFKLLQSIGDFSILNQRFDLIEIRAFF